MHDLLVTLAFLVFFRFDLSLNVIAALLTMTGYSTNDTIVIFDRVRENLRGMRRDNIVDLVNASINQTLNRTIITGGTALLAVDRAVLLRRRGAEGVRVHDDRRDDHRHLLERLHRGGDRHLLAARQGRGPDRGVGAPGGQEPPRPRGSARRAAASAPRRPAAVGIAVAWLFLR